jgi:hypothetical protein
MIVNTVTSDEFMKKYRLYAMENEMRKYTLADLREGMHDLLAKEN